MREETAQVTARDLRGYLCTGATGRRAGPVCPACRATPTRNDHPCGGDWIASTLLRLLAALRVIRPLGVHAEAPKHLRGVGTIVAVPCLPPPVHHSHLSNACKIDCGSLGPIQVLSA